MRNEPEIQPDEPGNGPTGPTGIPSSPPPEPAGNGRSWAVVLVVAMLIALAGIAFI